MPLCAQHLPTERLVAMFEQYLTMVINPNINGTMIANMTDSEYSEER